MSYVGRDHLKMKKSNQCGSLILHINVTKIKNDLLAKGGTQGL